jgi:hypothetical protein
VGMVSEPRILRGRGEIYSWHGEAEGTILLLAFWLDPGKLSKDIENLGKGPGRV